MLWLVNQACSRVFSKKSVSNTKQRLMRLFESKLSKLDNNTPTHYKPKKKKKRKIGDAFEGRYVEYKDKKIETGKKLSMKG